MNDCEHNESIKETVYLQTEPYTYAYECGTCGEPLQCNPDRYTEFQSGERSTLTYIVPATGMVGVFTHRDKCIVCGGDVFWSDETDDWLHEASGIDHEVVL